MTTTALRCLGAYRAAEDELKEREVLLTQQHQQQQRLQQQAAAGTEVFPDPLQAVSDIASAYSAEQGFREMSVQELSVALTAGGLVDVLLDVRSEEEFAAGELQGGCLKSSKDSWLHG